MPNVVKRIELCNRLKNPKTWVDRNQAKQCQQYLDKLYEAINTLNPILCKLPVVCVIVFGSFAKEQFTCHSDIDLMVLLKDDYEQYGGDMLQIRWELEDLLGIECGEYVDNRRGDIPIDLHVNKYSNLWDLSTDEHFKREVLENNFVVWECENYDSRANTGPK